MTEDSPLSDIVAELERYAHHLLERQETLASEQVTVQALDGRLSATAAADGRLLALHIDPSAVRGHQGRQLSDHLERLITTVLEKAAVRRAELESDDAEPLLP
jgi:DNA-binding protein YbaB